MSNVQAATKVANQLILRLFDQRQFTSGELSHMAEEFDRKVNLESGIDKLSRINENMCVIADIDHNNTFHSSCKLLEGLCERMSTINSKAMGLLESEQAHREREESQLANERRRRDQEKRDRQQLIYEKLEELDRSLVEEELELERKYLKFESNLRNK